MDLNPIDAKKLKTINDYPLLTVCIVEALVIIFLFSVVILPDKKEYNDHLKQELLEIKSRVEKKDENYNLYNKLTEQIIEFNKIIQKKDTS